MAVDNLVISRRVDVDVAKMTTFIVIFDPLDWSDEDDHARNLEAEIEECLEYIKSKKIHVDHPRSQLHEKCISIVSKHEIPEFIYDCFQINVALSDIDFLSTSWSEYDWSEFRNLK